MPIHSTSAFDKAVHRPVIFSIAHKNGQNGQPERLRWQMPSLTHRVKDFSRSSREPRQAIFDFNSLIASILAKQSHYALKNLSLLFLRTGYCVACENQIAFSHLEP